MTEANDKAFAAGEQGWEDVPNLGDLSHALDKMAQNIETLLKYAPPQAGAHAKLVLDRKGSAALALDIYEDRRRRVKLFGADLFGEPAWDILLDLFIATATGKQISVSSACIGSAVPSTTGLRWLAVLETRGLIVRENDDRDARRSHVRLSKLGHDQMEQYLKEVRTCHGIPPEA
ncbi:MAG: hypothetical protein M3N34_01850 [Pseudomonadota bacterium]|nr:hypothetical protein [Pseudomonadota bacterium]